MTATPAHHSQLTNGGKKSTTAPTVPKIANAVAAICRDGVNEKTGAHAPHATLTRGDQSDEANGGRNQKWRTSEESPTARGYVPARMMKAREVPRAPSSDKEIQPTWKQPRESNALHKPSEKRGRPSAPENKKPPGRGVQLSNWMKSTVATRPIAMTKVRTAAYRQAEGMRINVENPRMTNRRINRGKEQSGSPMNNILHSTNCRYDGWPHHVLTNYKKRFLPPRI